MSALAEVVSTTTRTVPSRIPPSRVIGIELRKMFDTRSGFWLMSSIVALSVIATGAVIVFGSEDAIAYGSFAAAVGIPMAVILPMVAILSVTSEWSQRSGLSTFTLVPHRGRVIAAKATAALIVGVVSMVIAMVVGALGNLIGAAIVGVDPVWDLDPTVLLTIILATVLGMFMGFTLGVLIRNSAGAIVTYFVITMVIPPLSELLAFNQSWFRDLQPWVDFNLTRNALYDAVPTGEQWAQLALSGTIWLVIPLTIGLLTLRRSEVS